MISIKEEIIQILQDKLQCPCERIEKNMELPLTGQPFYLSEIDMVYLLFEIEKKYRIRVEGKYLINYMFSTVNHIEKIVSFYLLKKQNVI